ncbi:ribonuclease H1 small subunit [Macroventuria anomochaeta]|uniref:Ribonuclease H1 small subunit n=1 Tax=Macroventuria anomochaeta TaxID=301207 RepID=A0ACB6SBB1_9PLEO|nr:ribonuclease H1 small subunit [Macroventuria anomochaeta]KAF2631262.1 ribonuclease H1 small subunit [Macroventuria anomochaeta]
MLSIQNAKSKKCTPNLLPARINHNGPINSTPRYWAPTTDEKGTQHVHFRGRHLHGTTLPLPSNYTGAVLNITDKLAPQTQTRTLPSTATESTNHDDDEDMEQELLEEVKVAEQIGEFDSIVVWGHGGVVDEGSDMFVRGVREWVDFAEALHCDEEDGVETNGAKPS